MPFENRYAAFQAARQEMQKKYALLAEHYNRLGYSLFLDAFIVGALGGWDPASERIVNQLKMGQTYCRLIKNVWSRMPSAEAAIYTSNPFRE